MAIKVLPSQQIVGIQTESQFCLAFLLWIMDTTVFPNPFTIANVKAALDSGQPAAWETANFKQVLSNCLNMNLDTTVLNATERTRLNLIFEYLNPAPQSYCSGIDFPATLNTSIATYERIGSATFEYEVQVLFDFAVTGDVYTVKATITPNGGAPAPTTNPVDFYFKQCDSNINKRVFTKLWLDFPSSPVGLGYSYDFSLEVKDSALATINIYPVSGVVFT